MKQLLVATRNRHKVREIQAILGGDLAVTDLSQFPDAPVIVEDAPTFEGNAIKKALSLAAWLGDNNRAESGAQAWVLADDSGLEVDALNGAPGVHSARFAALETGPLGVDPETTKWGSCNSPIPKTGAAGNSPDAANNARLLRLLTNVPEGKRTARFRCVLCLAPVKTGVTIADVHVFQGVCEGRIAFTPAGQGGFGYDPLFVPRGHQQSFAELGEAVKNTFSHRARALQELVNSVIDILGNVS